jgi:multiple sugar transport system substrate-binding protein
MREERHPLAGVRQQRGGGAGPGRKFFGHDGEDIGVGLDFLEALCGELTSGLELEAPNPYLSMAIGLVRAHLEARPMTQTSLIAGASVPYATAMRRLAEMDSAGLLERRARSRSGRSFSIHPSQKLVDAVAAMAARVRLLSCRDFGDEARVSHEHYFLGSYRTSANISPPRILPRALSLPGGLRVLAHADPTFMVMDNLKRQFEQVIGARIQLRALSIDKLREEAVRNADRKASRYDIVATDLPWIGEFAERGVLLPLDSIMDVGRLDTTDFHPMGWRAAHWAGRAYGAPSQTTPELLFYRRDLFAEAGLEPPRTTDDVLAAARYFHRPARGRYGIAWNAARGTPLGHTFIMACADFGQPVMNLRPVELGFDPDPPAVGSLRPTIDTPMGLEAAGYLRALLAYSPPDILSMGWYERIRPYAAGRVAMAYSFTALAPFVELDPSSPANGQTGYLPHPSMPGGRPIATVGGYVLGVPANLPLERRCDAVEALVAFTSREAQKLFILNGCRTSPRYSVGTDPEVRRLSPIFEAVDAMSSRDELQFWPRPPVPQIAELIQICGEEMHAMLRGVCSPREALRKAQARADLLTNSRQTDRRDARRIADVQRARS